VSAGSCCVAHGPPSLSASGTGPDGCAHPVGRAAHSGVDDPINFAPHGRRELLHGTIDCRSNDRFRGAHHRVPYRLPDRPREYLQHVILHRAHDACPFPPTGSDGYPPTGGRVRRSTETICDLDLHSIPAAAGTHDQKDSARVAAVSSRRSGRRSEAPRTGKAFGGSGIACPPAELRRVAAIRTLTLANGAVGFGRALALPTKAAGNLPAALG